MLLYQVLASLAAAYFSSKHLRWVTVVSCWQKHENVHLMQSLATDALSANIFQSSVNFTASEFVANLKENNHTRIGVLLPFNCAQSVEIIRQCSAERCFSQKFYWLMWNEPELRRNSTDSAVLRELNSTNLHVDSEITFADLREARTHNATAMEIPLYDVYNNGYHAGGHLRVNYDNLFSSRANSESLLESAITDALPKYVRRMNLSDLALRVGTVYQIIDGRPLTSDSILDHLRSENNTQFDVLNRPIFQMAEHIQALLGYSSIWCHRPLWGINDTHGGALGDIIAGNTDIAYVLAGLNMNRLAYMHPICEMRDFRSVFFFRTFGSQKAELIENVFFKPFVAAVWWVLGACILALAAGIHAVLRAEWWRNVGSLPFAPSAMLSVVSALGAFCQQGAWCVPASGTGRFLMLVLYVTSILIYTYYTTEVLSALISSPVTTNIKTLAQLARSGLTVGLENVSHTATYLNITTTPDLQLLKERKLQPVRNASKLWTPLAEGLDRVRRGGHAYHCEDTHAYAYIRRTFDPVEMCDINEIYLRAKLQVGYMSHKQSPYLEMFKTKFRKLKETGIVSKYNRKWMPAKPACLVDSFVFSVGMEYVGPLFVFLAMSMVLSGVVMVAEMVDWRMRGTKGQVDKWASAVSYGGYQP